MSEFDKLSKEYNKKVEKLSTTRKGKRTPKKEGGLEGEKKEEEKELVPAIETPKSKKQSYIRIPVLYMDDGVIYTGNRDPYHILHEHHIFIKYQTQDENDQYTWILEIRSLLDETSIFLEITHDQFCNAKDLSKIFTSKFLVLNLSEASLRNLQLYLFTETKFAKATKVSRYGFDKQSGLFFFSNVAISADKKYTPNEFAMVELEEEKGAYSMPERKKKDSFYTYKENEVKFADWFNLFSQVHTHEIAFMAVNFYFMSLFRDIVVEKTKASPILFMKGSAGTGKSSIADAIAQLFGGVQKANLKNKNTEPALIKLLSQSANCVVWFDEYHNDITCEGLLQASYDNDGYHRSSDSSTNQTNSVNIYSALLLTSNYLPNNPVFFSRCIYVPVPTPEKTKTQRLLYEELEKLNEKGTTTITAAMLQYRELIAEKFEMYYNQIYATLKAQAKEERIDERYFTNISRLLTPGLILCCEGKIALTENTEKAGIIDDFSMIGYQYLSRQFRISNEQSPLFEFFEILNTLFERFQIHENIHFRFGVGEHKGNIALRFGKIYSLFAENYRKAKYTTAPKKEEIQAEILNLLQKSDWKELEKRARFSDDLDNQKNESYACIWLPLDLLKDKFELNLSKRALNK